MSKALDITRDRMLPIVVGAHIEAEMGDRPSAYRVRARIEEWQAKHCDEAVFVPVVMTDVWYVNHEAEGRGGGPVISIGEPRVNALAAHLAARVPAAFVVDDELIVQFDQRFEEQGVCVWGAGSEATARAVDVFLDRYLDDCLRGWIGMRETEPEESAKDDRG